MRRKFITSALTLCLLVSPLIGCTSTVNHKLTVQTPPEVVAPRSTMSDTIKAAERFLWSSERVDRKRLSEYVGVDVLTVPWCAYFVTAVLKDIGVQGTGSGLARSYLSWGVETKNPQVGDIVVFKRGASWQGHVAFYLDQNENFIKVLGGNQNDAVSIKWYPKKDFLEYRTIK